MSFVPPDDKTNFINQMLSIHKTPEDAIEALVKEINAHPVDARLNLQVFLNAMGREEESFAVSQQLASIAPQDPRVLFNYGWHLLKRGELQNGMSFLENGRLLNTYGHPLLKSSRPLWIPENGHNQHVLLVLEGGFGDEMIHVRFGKILVEKYNCKVTVVCNPKLAPLFARLPWVGAVAQREAALGIYHDSWLPGMSAAFALGFEYSDLTGEPYLLADPARVAVWKHKLVSSDKKIKIGVRWAGNPQFEHQQLRLFPPNIIFDLAKDDRVQLYSLQKDSLPDFEMPTGIIDLDRDLRDWDDTAAAIMNMDLVISSCTSVAHLSAALGKKTWVVVPALPYFIWALPGETSPWYDSVQLFRQTAFGDWNDVAEKLKVAVSKLS